MPKYSQTTINQHFARGDTATTTTGKGRALEDLICYIFEKVPGIVVTKRNPLNVFATEEIDIGFWNDKHPKGFYFLPHIIIVECKNWSNPTGSTEVGYFSKKLENRGRDYGILVAANGITGSSTQLTGAHYEIAMALSRGLHIIVLTRQEIVAMHTTDDLVKLSKEKLCELAIMGTIRCSV